MHETRRDIGVTASREIELRKMLKERQQDLMNELQRHRRQLRTKATSLMTADVVDTAEFAEADIQDDLRFSLLQLKTETLERVEDALRRLDSGRFGLCVECDDEIHERRLRAMPFALRCTECEDARERKIRQLQSAPRRVPLAAWLP